jgi:hypothetical protein
MWQKRLPGWEPYDMITIETVPRFKTSGLSGDQWRTSAKVTLWFKSEAICERFFGDVKAALAFLPGWRIECCEPIETKVIEIEKGACDQPGCSELAVSRYRIRKEYSEQGLALEPDSLSGKSYRQFCKRHLRRGDCSREDSDDNYEVLSGPGPDEADGWREDVSESVFGGVVEVSDE